MRRADRLFRIVQHLRGGRLVTARQLSVRLEVSERTIYRDIADLQASGVPIDGEAGVGYLMRDGFELPPLMFSRDEITALVAGARLVQGFGGTEMARSAAEALVKIAAVLPAEDKARVERTAIHAFPYGLPPAHRALLDTLDAATDAREVLCLCYCDEGGRETERHVHPLGLWFWGKVWTLVAWCELRDDFRMFRIDRIRSIAPAGRTFRPDRKRSLSEFFRREELCDMRRALQPQPAANAERPGTVERLTLRPLPDGP